MQVLFYGHACLKLVASDGAVIMDPWFSREGAFFRGWFQFPENWPLLDAAFEGVSDVCVSHNHADHLDDSTLSLALERNPALRVHIPRYQSDFLLKRVARLLPAHRGRFVEHAPWEPFSAGGASVFFVPEKSPGSVDSAIVASAGGRTLVNLNDSRLSSDQLLEIKGRMGAVDSLALQCSGASEYPVCYSYLPEEMRRRALKKRREKFELSIGLIDLLEPRRVLFFAGPPAFLDPAFSHLNARAEDSVFPDMLDILHEMQGRRPDIAERALFLLPGDAFDDAFLWPKTDLASERAAPYARKDEYLAAYARRRADLGPFDDGEPPAEKLALAHFDRMARLSPYLSASIGGEIVFVVRGRTRQDAYTVDFAARSAYAGRGKTPLYVLEFPASEFAAVLDGSRTWDDVFLSLRMRFDERTDRFVMHFKTVLRYMDPALFSTLEDYERRLHGEEHAVDMIDVTCGASSFRIQRACPHAGNDLERHGRADPDGTITCLAHRFRFDMKTGECLNARGYRLKVEPLAASQTPRKTPASP